MIESRLFNKGMNQDLAVEFIPQGQYRTALNVRVGYSETDSVGTAETPLGNALVTNIDVPYNNGVYKCIGSKLDPTSNKIYGFLFNSLTQHRIIEYDTITNSISTVLESPVLNFSPNYLITSIAIVYKESDEPLLYWTDGGAPNGLPDPQCGSTVLENPMRKVNINKAKQYTLGNPNPVDAYQTIDVQVLDYIKWPPVFAPQVQMLNDITVNKNNIKGNIFQFRSAWRYDDFEKTAWSPISKIVTPVGDETINNVNVPPQNFNNAIDITLDTGSEIVSVIYIAVRRSNNGGADTEGDFYLVATLNKYDANGNVLIPSNSTYTYRFYNDKALEAINLREQDLEYDDVPIYNQAMEYIYGNRMVWGNYAQQFDLVEPQVTLLPQRIDLGNPQPTLTSPTLNGGNTPVIDGVPVGPNPYVLVTIPNSPYPYQAGDILSAGGILYSYVVSAQDVDADTLAANYAAYLQEQGLSVYYGNINYFDPALNPYTTLPNQFLSVQPLSVTQPGFNSLTAYPSVYKYLSYKEGAVHPIGIRYYDRGNRACSVIRNNTFDVYIPFPTELSNPSPYIKRYIINTGIAHRPPVWATHYQWVYAKNSTVKSFIQTSIRSVSVVGNQTKLGLQPILDFADDNPSSILSYTYTKGDRMRIITDGGNTVFPQYVDVPVNGYDETTQLLSVDKINIVGISLGIGTLIEIYTPKETLNTEQIFYYEISEEYEIGDAGLDTRYHKGELQDQDPNNPSIPAVTILDRGDVWVKPRQMTTTNDTTFHVYWVEDYNFSDFYSSIVWDKGRPSIFNPDFKRVVREANVGYSEPFIPETNINGLSRVYDSSFQQYERKYRGIQLLKNKNRNLIVFQELKVGTLMINQQVARDANGGTFVLQTDSVLNPLEYYQKESGIGKHPESYAEDRGNMYYVDVLRGEVIRLGQDGMNAISDYGMHNYFKNLFARIVKSGVKVHIYGAFNKRFGQYEIAFERTRLKGSDVLEPITVAYFENENYWSSFYSYYPENMCNANDDLVTFKNGRAWLHNVGTYNNYYGVQYESTIDAVSNAQPKESKTYLSTSVETNQTPEYPAITTRLGQTSYLLPNHFKFKEGKYYADFKRALNTVNVPNPLINGNRLRGEWAIIRIKIGTNTYGRLFSVNFNMAYSAPNGR